jgi:hypothetical protein
MAFQQANWQMCWSQPVRGLSGLLHEIKSCFRVQSSNFMCTVCIRSNLIGSKVRVAQSLPPWLWSIFLKLWSSEFLCPSAIHHLGISSQYTLFKNGEQESKRGPFQGWVPVVGERS